MSDLGWTIAALSVYLAGAAILSWDAGDGPIRYSYRPGEDRLEAE